jgi:hypothetical protein
MKYTSWSLVVLSTFLLISCDDEHPHTPIALTPQAEKLRMEYLHLEQDLFNADFKNSDRVSQDLYQKYGAFWCNYIEQDLALAACTSDSVQKLLYPFVVNTAIMEANQSIRLVFSTADFENYQEQLTTAMQKWQSLYPDKQAPKIVFYQSAWNNNISPMDDYLGISLDCYLGTQHPVIQKLSTEIIPSYKKQDMRKDHLVADAVKGWVAYQHRSLYQPKDLLHEFIFYGKLMHISRSLLPETPDSTLLNWTSKELAWAQANEWNTWKEVAREDCLFNKKMNEINKWFAQGPFTGAKNMPQESSSQLGIWIGWQMVSQYMAKNSQISIAQMLSETDDLKILAAYSPKRP